MPAVVYRRRLGRKGNYCVRFGRPVAGVAPASLLFLRGGCGHHSIKPTPITFPFMSNNPGIDKASLRLFLESARATHHHIYALLTGLPKDTFYIERFEVTTSPYRNRNEDKSFRCYTVAEFFGHYDDFDPGHEFGLCWVAPLERIACMIQDDYNDGICVGRLDCLNMEDIEHFIVYFLHNYCEKCLYENRPFEMSEQIMAAFGFTEADAAWYRKHVDYLNDRIKREMRREYRKLHRLEFIRNGGPAAEDDENPSWQIVPRLLWGYMER